MQQFEITVKDSNYAGEMEIGICHVSRGYEDELAIKRSCSTDIPKTTYIARMATAVMSRFCAYIFPRYDVTIHLGKPREPYYFYGEYGSSYEMRIYIRGVMSKEEQDRLVELLNRVVAESQREAMK